MLTQEQNHLLTQVGPGTRMGNLLRRYWMPIAAVSEFEKTAIKPIRLMGEDLVLYKDLSGTFGLVDRHCPHRRADLSYGFVEECGIRCNYHGWLFAEDGRCLEQPFEDTAHPEARFRDKVRATAYPLESKAGMLWAYLGPLPVPLLPNWEPFTWKNGFVQIVFSKVPCNWLQCQENAFDPVHLAWLHNNWPVRRNGKQGPLFRKIKRIEFREFDWGFTYHRLVEGMSEDDPLLAAGRSILWPIAFGPITPQRIEFHVPTDDENTLTVSWDFTRVPKEREPYVQESIPYWEGPLTDPVTGRWIVSNTVNEDFLAWSGQGRIADRTKETLASSDRGITLMRRRFLDDIERIERGEDPKGVIRDPHVNATPIRFPVDFPHLITDGMPLAEMIKIPRLDPLRGYMPQFGQPASVSRQFVDAMGLDPDTKLPEGQRDYERIVAFSRTFHSQVPVLRAASSQVAMPPFLAAPQRNEE